MKVLYPIFCLVILLSVSATGLCLPIIKSTAEDQTAVEVTVYNDLGLIKEVRKVELSGGEAELRFMDVASSIMPTTVHVRSLNYPDDFTLLEQDYEYDLINEDKLLDKYVGKKIKIIDRKEFLDRKEVIDATLLSNNQGQIYRINDEIYLGHPGLKVLPEIPETLISRPTLTWLYACPEYVEGNSKKDNIHNLEVSYLAGNLSWKADYVAVLDEDDASADISGWVTIDNKSGASYKNAHLKLIAGEINIVKERTEDRAAYLMAMTPVKTQQFKEKEFFEYHIYNLQRSSTIKNNQTKQINLLEANGIKTQKELMLYGSKSYFISHYQQQRPGQPADIYVKFKISKEDNLGIPLPAGIMRLYKYDKDNGLQFIGEDRIEHTPEDEEISLKLGKAFDVIAERSQIDYKQITSLLHESEWEITIRNRKKMDITVGVVEPFSDNWEVINSSHPYKKVDAFTIRFDVNIPSNEEVKLRYRVRVGL